MKIVVIGGTGLIGSKLVTKLGEHGHQAVAASPNTGVNTLTGEGLSDALAGTTLVVDVANSPSFENAAVMEFFETSTRTLLAASGCFRVKIAQESPIEKSSIPYSLVHATQFFGFVARIADAAAEGGAVRLVPVLFQPIAGDDVAQAVGSTAEGSPLNGTVEIAGPEQSRMDEFFRAAPAARNDPREVEPNPHARYFGTELSERTLVPAGLAIRGEIRNAEWPGRIRE
ncbi:SDR family oxidoreductase [Amycolatopsis sp. NPDC051372]|uniref:SDR family oxidoreductase n=1 Tax=Amycolatopsis sp. NPDC051372 TaxID=3155669 RepID=UPI003439BB52